MKENENPTAQKLLTAFAQFKKLHWHRSPVKGFTSSEIMLLFCIKKGAAPGEPGMKVSEISKRLKVASPTVTQQINSLENRGLVERRMDRKDRRAVRVKLTDTGESVIKEASEAFHASFNGLVEYLGEEGSDNLAELLSKVYVYFDEKTKFDSETDRGW